MVSKDWWGFISLFFAILSGTPYIISILRHETKPHLFTHVIWSLTAGIAAAGQYSADAGPGAWAAALTAGFSIATALLALGYGEKTITRGDWTAFLFALAAIPLWYATASPLPAVALVTLIDVVGYYPTIRKSYLRPKEEMAFSYGISNVKHLASIAAMTDYSVTTLLFPTALFLANGALVAMLLWRRAAMRRTASCSG